MPTQSISFKMDTYLYIDNYAKANRISFSKANHRLITFGVIHLKEQKRLQDTMRGAEEL